MADKSKIEWTDATWNVITGCSVTSPGCADCYAMKLAGTRLKHHPSRQGLTTDTKAGPVWNGQVRFNEQWLTQPIEWKAPRRIFVCAHGDLFHENVPDEWIDQVFAVMAMASRHTFQVLTKRSRRMREYFAARQDGDPWAEAADEVADVLGMKEHPAVLEPKDMPLPNVWLGVSAEDQARADERIPDLLNTPAAIRFVSIEPMIGPVDLTRIRAPEDNDDGSWKFSALAIGDYYSQVDDSIVVSGDGPYRENRIDWVIVGGESGPKARLMHPAWVRTLRDQCLDTGVPFFFKQWGAWHVPNAYEGKDQAFEHVPFVRVGKMRAGAMLDGREWREMPE